MKAERLGEILDRVVENGSVDVLSLAAGVRRLRGDHPARPADAAPTKVCCAGRTAVRCPSRPVSNCRCGTRPPGSTGEKRAIGLRPPGWSATATWSA